jgi:hypothetical protein
VADRTVEQVCRDSISHPELLAGCNLFVQAVCAAFEYGDLFSKGDNADAMIGKFASAPFHNLGTDKDSATQKANEGKLVLAGLTLAKMIAGNPTAKKKPTMGHIVVVAPGGPCKQANYTLTDGTTQAAAGGYPYCYGGAAQALYRVKEKATISLVMPKASRDQTVYAWLDIPKPKK